MMMRRFELSSSSNEEDRRSPCTRHGARRRHCAGTRPGGVRGRVEVSRRRLMGEASIRRADA